MIVGFLVAAAVFLFRSRGPARRKDTEDVLALGEIFQDFSNALRQIPLSVGLLAVAFFLLFQPVFSWFLGHWRAGIWENGHGLFVPVAMVYFGYRALRGEENSSAEASAWGFAFLVPGLFLAVADSALHTRYLTAFGFLLTLPGLSLLLLGVRRTRKLALPLVLALFMLPVPYTFADETLLRGWTVTGSTSVLRAVGFSVFRDHTVLVFPQFSLDVTHACSGFSALYAGAFASVTLAAFAQPWWRKALLFLAIYPTALAANIVRVAILVVLVQEYGLGVLATDLHPLSGVVVFGIILGGLGLLAGRGTFARMFR